MLRKMFRLLGRIEEIFSSALLLCMVVVIAAQVFCRYALESSLEWSEEVARFIFIWAVYLGASYALQQGRHLEITILRHYLSRKYQRLLVMFAHVCVLLFCIYTAWFGGVMVLDTRDARLHTPALDAPAFWFWLCIPFCFSLMAVRAALKLWELCASPDAPLFPTH